jgi:hypothetical protein
MGTFVSRLNTSEALFDARTVCSYELLRLKIICDRETFDRNLRSSYEQRSSIGDLHQSAQSVSITAQCTIVPLRQLITLLEIPICKLSKFSSKTYLSS